MPQKEVTILPLNKRLLSQTWNTAVRNGVIRQQTLI